MEADERFAVLVDEFAGRRGVEVPDASRRRFGSDALKVDGSIFAMLRGGRLVVKLPRHRVDALIDSGAGSPFQSGKGRPMKEWVTVGVADEGAWLDLAREAFDFVRRRPPRS